MITDYMMIPQVIALNTWENLLDIWQTSHRRKIKDNARRIKVVTEKNGFHILLEKRNEIELKKLIYSGLWRTYPGYSSWDTILDLHVDSGISIFTINGFNFGVEIDVINPYQVTIGIIYEQRNVAAEEIGSIPPAISLTESWCYPENGVTCDSDG